MSLLTQETVVCLGLLQFLPAKFLLYKHWECWLRISCKNSLYCFRIKNRLLIASKFNMIAFSTEHISPNVFVLVTFPIASVGFSPWFYLLHPGLWTDCPGILRSVSYELSNLWWFTSYMHSSGRKGTMGFEFSLSLF